VFENDGSGKGFPHEFIAFGRVKTDFTVNLSTINADQSRSPVAAPARTISSRRDSRRKFQDSSSGFTHRSPGKRAKSRSVV
jgi:hypothetical protein